MADTGAWERLAELAALPQGWLDGTGKPIEPAAIASAKALLWLLEERGIPGARIYPTADGHVQLEWEAAELTLKGGDTFDLFVSGNGHGIAADLLALLMPRQRPAGNGAAWRGDSDAPAVAAVKAPLRPQQPVRPCPCECSHGGYCGGCAHAGCALRSGPY